MKAMRWLALGLVVCVVSAGARADEKADNAKLIVGKWEATKVDEGTLPKGSIVEFTKDGKLKITVKMGDQDLTIDGTYKVDGNKFTITMKMGDDEQTQTITIKKLSKTELNTENKDGKVVDLTRKQ